MYRIRFHGRGGQGIKTAGRILGTALFRAGFEVQDAPRYGAERRGAPIFAYVRADHEGINERGIISTPDLVVVADDSLLSMPGSGVLTGVNSHTTFFIHSCEPAQLWRERLNIEGFVITLPPLAEQQKKYLGASCAGSAARLLGLVSQEILEESVQSELLSLGREKVAASQEVARQAFAALAEHNGIVQEGAVVAADSYTPPAWIDLPCEGARLSAPAIHGGVTSEIVKTGLWRTERPIIDRQRCNRCWWLCSTFCPEGAIQVDAERWPRIDYDHCKGCMVCLAQCPAHAIEAWPEHEKTAAEGEES